MADSISCPKRTTKHGRNIPNRPELPPEAPAQLPLLYILGKEPKDKPAEDLPGCTPWYPQAPREATSTVDEDDRPNYILSFTTKMPPTRLDTAEPDPTLSGCQEQANVLRTVGTELHEHFLTRCGLKDLHLGQNRDVHLLALKKLMRDKFFLDDTCYWCILPRVSVLSTSLLCSSLAEVGPQF